MTEEERFDNTLLDEEDLLKENLIWYGINELIEKTAKKETKKGKL